MSNEREIFKAQIFSIQIILFSLQNQFYLKEDVVTVLSRLDVLDLEDYSESGMSIKCIGGRMSYIGAC